MRKKTLRILAIVILLSMLLSTATFAAVTASEYIAVTNTWISRDGNTVKVNFYIVGTNTMDQIGVKKILLYEKNGNTWSLVETYNYTDPLYAATMMGSSTAGKSGHVPYSGSASKDYYAKVTFYAEKDGGSDTFVQETPVG